MYPPKLQTIRLMNGIALLNTERAEGYNKLLKFLRSKTNENLHHLNLELVLSNFIRDSKLYSHTLNNIVLIEGGKMPYGIKADQQLYQMSIRMKELFADTSGQELLHFCRQCEEIMLNGYELVLNENRLGHDPKEIVIRQQKELIKAAELIQALGGPFIAGAENFRKTPVYQLHQAIEDSTLSSLSKPA
jgi:hypothetical protein